MDISAIPVSSARKTPVAAPSQTLRRGLDLIEAASDGAVTLTELAARLHLPKSTTCRLLGALVNRGYMMVAPGLGYRLGPKVMRLGAQAKAQFDLVQIARPHLERLAALTEDTVHLGVVAGGQALCLDEVPGRRRITITGRIGDLQSLTSTGLGKALILDGSRDSWQKYIDADQEGGGLRIDGTLWLRRMSEYRLLGAAFDLEEHSDYIRSVASPVRAAGGNIVAAVGVSSAAQYMGGDRITSLAQDVRMTAIAVSRELGHEPDAR